LAPVPKLDEIRAQLLDYRPSTAPSRERPAFEAAVAVVLHQPAGEASAELLFIERAQREGDPWSGHMAFPGGRREARDGDLQQTAARETLEEVGLALPEPLGRLDHFSGSRNTRVPPLLVAPYVYAVRERPDLIHNHEVNSTVWVPLRWILDPDSWIEYEIEREGSRMGFPAFRYDDYTVWGLTYRILRNFFDVVGRTIPSPEDD
jgi:8-oxo-dGTP pyrophosphatase MutT (NUDIX family)